MKAVLAAMAALALLPRPAPAADDGPRKAVLVTGASSGIGLRIAETLAENGFYVYAGARKAEDLARLDALPATSSVRLDVTVQDDIDAAAAFVKSQGRGLWGVVNNAGVVRYSPLASGPMSDVLFTFDVNVFGPMRVNQAFLPLLIESGGRTVTISSMNGFVAGGGDAGYAASKFAIEGYTDSLAYELSDSGVHVAAVEPGAYKSRIRDKMLAEALASADAGEFALGADERAALQAFAASNDDMQEPDDVAEAVLHLMTSDEPKRRYLVAPEAGQAAITIRAALERVVQLNTDNPYSYTREELIAVLDELLTE